MIRREFQRFQAVVERLLPDNPPFLPGSGEDELRLLEAELELNLPDELRTMLALAEGQDRRISPDGPINYQRFLTVDEILDIRTSLRRSVSDLATSSSQPSHYTDEVWSGHRGGSRSRNSRTSTTWSI